MKFGVRFSDEHEVMIGGEYYKDGLPRVKCYYCGDTEVMFKKQKPKGWYLLENECGSNKHIMCPTCCGYIVRNFNK